MLTVSWFYETFQHVLNEWPFMVLMGSFFIVTCVLKTGGIYLTQFRKFKHCVLITLLSNLFFFGGLFAMLFFQFKPTTEFQLFYGLLCLAFIFIDLLFISIFSRKASWISGVLGILFIDSLIISTVSIFLVIQFYLFA